MQGNVVEWVADYYAPDYYASSPASDPQGPSSGKFRVIRGGSWRNDKTYAHAASRFTYDTGVRYILNGFRVAKSLR
jgi:formylglycine-generating enzyme required for sulfatase activity